MAAVEGTEVERPMLAEEEERKQGMRGRRGDRTVSSSTGRCRPTCGTMSTSAGAPLRVLHPRRDPQRLDIRMEYFVPAKDEGGDYFLLEVLFVAASAPPHSA